MASHTTEETDWGRNVKRIFGQGSKRVGPALPRRRSLWSDKSGATIVEFAFIATPLAALMVAILQTSLVFFAQQNLETAVEKSARQLVTGSAQKAGMNSTGFSALVCSKLPAFMKCSNVYFDVRTVSSFGAASTSPVTPTYDSSGNLVKGNFTPGGPGSINVVRVMYIWNVGKGPLGFDLSTMSGQKRLLIATAVFQTEAYT